MAMVSSSTTTTQSLALLFLLNLLLFNIGTAWDTCNCHPRHCPCPRPPTPAPWQPSPRKCRPPPPPKRVPPPTPPTAPTPPTGAGRCPVDSLKLGVCVDVLKGLLNLTLGQPPKEPCCSLLRDLADLEAALCLCTVLKGSILGIILNLPINLSLVLNYCGKGTPKGFQCP